MTRARRVGGPRRAVRGAADAAGSPAPSRRSGRRRRSTRSAIASCTAGPRSSAPVRVDDGRDRARSRALAELAPLHQPKSLAALEAVERGPARRARGGLLRYRVPRHAARRGRDVRAPVAVAAALGPPALRLPRPVPRLCGSPGARRCSIAPATRRCGVVTCHLGAGASLAAVARRPVGGHDDGLHAARGAGDGDPLGQRGPGPHAVARGARGHAGRGARRNASSIAPGCSGWPGRPTCAPILDARRGRGPAARLALDVYLHRLRAAIAAMTAAAGRARRDRVHGRRRRALPGRPIAPPPTVFATSGSSSTERRNEADDGEPDREIGADGARVRALVVASREDVEIAREVRRVLAPA